MFRLPVILDDVMPASLRLASKKRNQFVNALAVVKRSNQGLHDADRPVISARITPGFEIMRFADMPVAKLGSFVVVKAEMNAERNLAVFERVREAKISRRIENGIPAGYHQQIHLA